MKKRREKYIESLESYFSEVYLPEPEQVSPTQRYRRLLETFLEMFGTAELEYARSPVRVNLIGEHTDYNEGPVLPAAVHRDIVAVFSRRTDKVVRIAEVDGSYGERTFSLSTKIPPSMQGDWSNYVKAGVQGVSDYVATEKVSPGELNGFDAVFHGTAPPAAGLSSSSALLVLSELIFLRVNEVQIGKKALAEISAEAEYYVGTRGGGMDHAACLLGEAGRALKIDFADFTIQPIPIPGNYRILVAHSLVYATKSDSAKAAYNRRAAEARIAAELFRRSLSRISDREIKETSIGTLRRQVEGWGEEKLEQHIEKTFPKAEYTLREIKEELGFSDEELVRRFYLEIPPDMREGNDVFRLRDRFRHVLLECRRVDRTAESLSRGEVDEVGALMDESHSSCRDLYEISCPELDDLVETLKAAGALGARMTGAGFGGCSVALCRKEEAENIRDYVIREYYQKKRNEFRDDYSEIIFPVKAVRGAEIIGDGVMASM